MGGSDVDVKLFALLNESARMTNIDRGLTSRANFEQVYMLGIYPVWSCCMQSIFDDFPNIQKFALHQPHLSQHSSLHQVQHSQKGLTMSATSAQQQRHSRGT